MSQHKTLKFLIIRFSAFGDVVQSLSLPTAIKQKYPTAEVHWVTRQDVSGLLENHPSLNGLWKYDKASGLKGLLGLALELKKQNFTHIYDAHNNSRSRILVWVLRPWGVLSTTFFIRRSIRRWRRFLLFRFRLNLFEQPFSGQRDLLEPLQKWGIPKALPPAPQLFLSAEVRARALGLVTGFERAIALAPSAAHKLKRWPAEYWSALILSRPDLKFVLLGGPEDLFLEEIARVAPDRVLNLAGQCSLNVSAGVVEILPALVSNDTGLLHVAEQLGKPAVALMGPAPFGFPSRPLTAVLERNLWCRPCSKHGQGPCINKKYFHECLRDISPGEVSKTLDAILIKTREVRL